MERECPQVLVLSFPQQGHIQPLLQVSTLLASKGFSITFPLSHYDYSRVSRAATSAVDGVTPGAELDIRLEPVPSLRPPRPHPDPLDKYERLLKDNIDDMAGLEEGVDKLVAEKLMPHLTFILADVFVTWAHKIASKYSIPLITFVTTNAMACTVLYHVPMLQLKGIMPFREENGTWRYTDPVDCLPGAKPLLPCDFPVCLTFWGSHFRYCFLHSMENNLHQSCGIILNTFEELEANIVAGLRVEKPIFTVGPLLLCRDNKNQDKTVLSYWQEQEECLAWLDKHPRASVLYVAFGSNYDLSVKQLQELALGLEASGQPFLWAIRLESIDGCTASSLDEALPEGFMKRTEDRGAIVSWAPQLKVLSHPSVGGFMSHSGWNSTLENLSLGGVPMICWPHAAEQRLNTRLLVDEWKIAMEFKNRNAEGLAEREEVGRVVKALMQSDEGKKLREHALHLKSLALKAVGENGSSRKNMEALANTLASHQNKT